MRLDTIFAIASMTKLLTAIAVLQLVERGKLTLETDIAIYLPELAEQPVLAEGSSAPSPRAKPITVRHLLTHTSGFGYANLAPRLDEWFRATGLNPDAGSTVAARFGHPLVFEPGTSWTYGAGIDWAGKLVEAVSGLDLDSYLRANVFEPLGMAPGSITFFPSRFEADGIQERMAGINHRDEWTGRVDHAGYWEETDEAFGGEGAFADLTAYFQVLESLLWDDERLLGTATAALLFQGLIQEPEAKAALNESTRDGSWIVGYVPNTGEYDWSAGGLLVDGDSHAWRKKGMVMWSGRFNSFWVGLFTHHAS
jgi:CubicO group peptidase (beta-lactamase class C family)